MDNPLVDLKSMKTEELQKNIAKLQHKLASAHHLGGNLVMQITTLLNAYLAEYQDRELMKEYENDPNKDNPVLIDTEDEAPKEDELDKLIEIG